jgi:glycosyltransferase involved in cell wall biosynthesis
MTRPVVTALINTYNYGHLVEEAIESALRQDFPQEELEVVVVDDGSADDTRQRVARFGDRVRYFYKENGGQASAISLGLEMARGELIALLDADDVWLPGKISRVVREFREHPEAGLVYHPMYRWDTETDTLGQDAYFFPIATQVPPTPDDLVLCPSEPTSALTFRASLARQFYPLPAALTIGMVDAYLGLLTLFVASVRSVPEYLAKYRIHGGNIGHGQDLCAGKPSAATQANVARRIACNQALLVEMRRWLMRRGIAVDAPPVAAFLKKWEIVEQVHRFRLIGAGRLEFFRHLRESQQLDRRRWPARYRIFRSLSAVAGLLLGYERYQALRQRYRQSTWMDLRESLFPASPAKRRETEPAPR